MIKALIFDFDGLIIDSESPEFEAWHELFAEYGRELGLELWADLVGRPPTHFDLYGYFCKHIDPVIEVEKLRQDRRARPCFSASHSPWPNSFSPVLSITRCSGPCGITFGRRPAKSRLRRLNVV